VVAEQMFEPNRVLLTLYRLFVYCQSTYATYDVYLVATLGPPQRKQYSSLFTLKIVTIAAALLETGPKAAPLTGAIAQGFPPRSQISTTPRFSLVVLVLADRYFIGQASDPHWFN